MKITYSKLEELIGAFQGIQNIQMPFRVSLLFAKNLAILQKEEEFYFEQERKFAQDFLVFNEDGTLATSGPNMYQVKPGKEQECAEARAAIDSFEVDLDLRKIPISYIEDLELTPAQVSSLMILIEEE